MNAQYWVAQYIPDLFRNEPRNIGVIAQVGSEAVARFVGETPDLQVDGRKTRAFPYPDVYRQWVAYWRSRLSAGKPDSLKEDSGHHYRIVEGGLATDIGYDSPEDVVAYLYALLVAEGGFREATQTEENTEDTIDRAALQTDIETAFQNAHILADSGDLLVQHPIRRGVKLAGTGELAHAPAFVQRNGQLFVMESVDFRPKQAQRSRDHAGWSAYMFKDLRSVQQDIETIAIVRMREEDLRNEIIENGYTLIKKEASSIVHWLDAEERRDFLEERTRVALAQ